MSESVDTLMILFSISVCLSLLVLVDSNPNVTVFRRDVTWIGVQWTLDNTTTATDFTGFKVSFEGGGANYVTTNVLGKNVTTFSIEGLKISTKYYICVMAIKTTGNNDIACVWAETLAPIRVDGLIVVIVLLGYGVGCLVLGWCWWRHKKAVHALDSTKGSRDLEKASYCNNIEDDNNSLNDGYYTKRTPHQLHHPVTSV